MLVAVGTVIMPSILPFDAACQFGSAKDAIELDVPALRRASESQVKALPGNGRIGRRISGMSPDARLYRYGIE
jgi:hypothetical protein